VWKLQINCEKEEEIYYKLPHNIKYIKTILNFLFNFNFRTVHVVYIMWQLGAYQSISTKLPRNIHTTTYYTEFYQPKPKLTCNSEGTDELPEDGTQLPKHIRAAK
jgi:hypothetical protein